jgi:hypothetical protein
MLTLNRFYFQLCSAVAGILSCSSAYALERGVALFDLAQLNNEASSSTFSVEQALQVAGIPYIVTTDIASATQYAMVVTSSYFPDTSKFINANGTVLRNYVNSGGVLVAANIKSSSLNDLFGIETVARTAGRYSMSWQMETGDHALRYFDDPYEQTINFAFDYETVGASIPTRGYALSSACQQAGTCKVLAKFDDGSAAVIKNSYGAGKVYTLGFSYTDIIVRNMMNRDGDHAQRAGSNEFEPAVDVFELFFRAVYLDNVAYGVWKHTSLHDSQATVMLTHDVDCATGMQLMNEFAAMENAKGVPASYNITTHYLQDDQLSPFYSNYFDKVLELAARPGVSIQSHSVGHFPDFADQSVFPVGAAGNTKENYRPYCDGTETDCSTTGGTVYGELEVSKALLEDEIAAPQLKTFRSGYLAFNNYQIQVLEQLGYLYDSSYSANDVLTNFPYLLKYNRRFSDRTANVYEIPVTISDSGSNSGKPAADYPAIVAKWLDVTARNAANSAPTTLLVHPNRDYKIAAQEDYITSLQNSPVKYYITTMEEFGDFWRERAAVNFTSSVDGDELTITLKTDWTPSFSLAVADGQAAQIVVKKADGTPVTFLQRNVGTRDVILYAFNK